VYAKEEALDKIKQHSRNYAKRQLTWLSRYARIMALDPKSELSLQAQALQQIG
jgi:tRNA A37 N6-isopentenylltransferase MiaA